MTLSIISNLSKFFANRNGNPRTSESNLSGARQDSGSWAGSWFHAPCVSGSQTRITRKGSSIVESTMRRSQSDMRRTSAVRTGRKSFLQYLSIPLAGFATTLFLATSPESARAQATGTITCDGLSVETLGFSGATLSSGTALQPGSVYDFANVAAGVDAQIEVLGFFNGASLNAIDNDAGLADYLQPEIVPNPAGGGFVRFRVNFLDAGTGAPEAVTFSATQIDVDGDSNTLREFVEFENPFTILTVDATTELLNNASGPSAPNFGRFESTTANTAPGIDPSAAANAVRIIYSNVTSYEFAYGTLDAGATTRLSSQRLKLPLRTTVQIPRPRCVAGGPNPDSQ